jgi:spore germination protein
VRPGDSLYKIAQQYDVPPNTIAEANRLPNPDALVVGQAVVIPGNFFTHTVRSGQTLFSIARSYGIPLQALLEANPGLSDASRLLSGRP